MKSHSSVLSLVIATCFLASCASLAPAQQSLSIETAEPGAAVYLEVEGVAIREMGVPGVISGTIGERQFVRDFGYIGTTPLTYSVPTYGESSYVRVPGRFRSGEERYARTGYVRVEHPSGVVQERQFTVRSGALTLSFDGASKAVDAVGEAGTESR